MNRVNPKTIKFEDLYFFTTPIEKVKRGRGYQIRYKVTFPCLNWITTVQSTENNLSKNLTKCWTDFRQEFKKQLKKKNNQEFLDKLQLNQELKEHLAKLFDKNKM